MDRALYDVWHGRYTYGLTNDVILKAIDQEYLEWKEVDNPEADYLDAFVAEVTSEYFRSREPRPEREKKNLLFRY